MEDLDTPLSAEDIRSQGINANNWDRAKELGWAFYENVGPGSFSLVTTMQDRGFDVRMGPPMGPDGPVDPDPNEEVPFRGVYVFQAAE